MIWRAVGTVFGLSNSAMLGGIMLVTSADDLAALVAQQSISPETTISGITLAALAGGMLGGCGLLIAAVKVGARFGSDVTEFKTAAQMMTDAAPNVAANTQALLALNDRIEKCERWQREHEAVILEWKRRIA